jgi:hypothetical protein
MLDFLRDNAGPFLPVAVALGQYGFLGTLI